MKLGSLVVHAQELDPSSPGAAFDYAAIKALADDDDVAEWLARFPAGLLPEKRT